MKPKSEVGNYYVLCDDNLSVPGFEPGTLIAFKLFPFFHVIMVLTRVVISVKTLLSFSLTWDNKKIPEVLLLCMGLPPLS